MACACVCVCTYVVEYVKSCMHHTWFNSDDTMDLILLDACSFPLSVERIAKIWGQFVATCVERKVFQTSEN